MKAGEIRWWPKLPDGTCNDGVDDGVRVTGYSFYCVNLALVSNSLRFCGCLERGCWCCHIYEICRLVASRNMQLAGDDAIFEGLKHGTRSIGISSKFRAFQYAC